MKILTSKKILFASIPAILFAGLFVFWRLPEKERLDLKSSEPCISAEIKIAESPEFYRLLARVETLADQSPEFAAGEVWGGIIPHHELAAEMIADFFYRLSKIQPQIETFVILGPNHDDLAEQIISAPVNWQLAVGELDYNNDIYQDLLTKKIIAENFEVLKNEHSVKVPVPYIAHYFPEAQIVPIIFTSGLSETQIIDFSASLAQVADEKTMIIGSLDFSHYLPSVMTADKDAVTLVAIDGRDYRQIANFNNDYIDSAVTLNVFLRIMDLRQATYFEVLQHHNSADYFGREINSSTSYFTLFFY